MQDKSVRVGGVRAAASVESAPSLVESAPSSVAAAPPAAGKTPVPLPTLASQITELARQMNATQHRWLVLIAEFDRREGWADGTTQSCAHWLSWKCGVRLGAAREKVRVARALESLPLISASMARGALSYSKVRALTRVATPEVEKTLLMLAERSSADHVETMVRQYRHAQEAMELSREAIQVANRGLRYYFDDDGSLVMQVRLPAEAGALMLRALDRALVSDSATGLATGDELAGNSTGSPLTGEFNESDAGGVAAQARGPQPFSAAPSGNDVSAETFRQGGGRADGQAFNAVAAEDTITQRRADALVRFAESYLSHGLRALSGGERHQIVVHVSAETLGHHVPGQCTLDDGPALAAETVRRMACDASIITVTEGAGGNLLDVGRKTRSISPALARALRSRDGGCRFPGCTHKRFVDGHHIHHWADGGPTRLSNLVLLCRFHHRRMHEGRFSMQMLDDGALRFFDAHGETLDTPAPRAGDNDRSDALHGAAGGLRGEPGLEGSGERGLP